MSERQIMPHLFKVSEVSTLHHLRPGQIKPWLLTKLEALEPLAKVDRATKLLLAGVGEDACALVGLRQHLLIVDLLES